MNRPKKDWIWSKDENLWIILVITEVFDRVWIVGIVCNIEPFDFPWLSLNTGRIQGAPDANKVNKLKKFDVNIMVLDIYCLERTKKTKMITV